jgi:hypothetical protein
MAAFTTTYAYHVSLPHNLPENEEILDSWEQDLLSFLELFPGLKQFALCYHPHDEVGRLTSLSASLQLKSLNFLSLAGADCAESDLATLFRNHKDTLKEIHLEVVEIMEGEGSWTSLERMVNEELSTEKFVHIEHE